ncbi:MAG TPA: hypothetical protein P5511_04150 [Candidatus Goldiibacteriota bacterium]|nr:hypothetical protein [Candidatus Goldiibacteriota bacterium]
MRKMVAAVLIMLAVNPAAFGGVADSFIIGHITTCSGLMDNSYPADSTNWFYRTQHRVVQFWAYFLFPASGGASVSIKNKYFLFLNPYEFYSGNTPQKTGDNDNFSFENKFISPSGKIICEKVMSWQKSSSDKRLTVDGRQYVPYTFANFIGINQTFPENGQQNIPQEQGLYHIDLYINGELVSVTFFEIKD